MKRTKINDDENDGHQPQGDGGQKQTRESHGDDGLLRNDGGASRRRRDSGLPRNGGMSRRKADLSGQET
jgi:hypothetical protein